jgi:HEAT repeat protein
MRKFFLLAAFLGCFSIAFSQTPADSVNHAVDSLFIRASSGMVMFRDLVEPSQKALAAMGESAVPRLIEKLKTQDAREMQSLESIFKLIGHPSVSYLVTALSSDESYTRRLSARILGEIRDTSSVDGLLQCVNHDDYRLRAGVITALGKIGDRRAVAPSVKALSDENELVRTAAGISLTYLADSSATYPLIEALSDPYYGTRFTAAEALAKIGEPAMEPVKNALLEPKRILSFYLLIEIAGNIKSPEFIDPLSDIVNSDDYNARAFAAEALVKIGGKKAEKAISQRLKIEKHPLVLGKLQTLKQ